MPAHLRAYTLTRSFLVENLVDARKRFNKIDFASMWIVFLTNIVVGEYAPRFALLVALGTGIVLAAFGFAFQFARKAKLSPPTSGELHTSTAIRSAAQEMKLGVLGCWFHIFEAQGYIFFGTASSLYRLFQVQILMRVCVRERA